MTEFQTMTATASVQPIWPDTYGSSGGGPAFPPALLGAWHVIRQGTPWIARAGTSATIEGQPAPRRLLRSASACSDALFRAHDQIAESLKVGEYLDAAAISRYRALFGTLAKLEAEDVDDRVESGAVASAKKLVSAFLIGKWVPPEIAWHGGDAIVLYWTIGDTSYLFTVTDGEVSYSERQGRKIARRGSATEIDGNWLRCLE